MNVTRYKCSILLVDDDPGVLSVLSAQLATDFDVLTASTASEARGVLAKRSVDMVLSDLSLPDESGTALLDWVRRTAPRTFRILLTGTARLEDAADAINQTQIHRMVLKPWRGEDLLQSLRAARGTLLSERSSEQLNDDLRKLNQELEQRVNDRTRELEAALAQIQQKNTILEKMALTDPLTGLPNRRAIDLIARKELLRRARTPTPLAVAIIDADHFKNINTQYLLPGGDHVLIWLASVLQGAIRTADSLGRIGGEEFLVVAPATDMTGAEKLAERLRTAVESSKTVYNGHEIRITISLGLAVCEAGVNAGYDVLRDVAAEAVKEAKDLGRNQAVIRQITLPPTP
ncbi:MAG: diguanylate cyclase [Planctomycetes bacterium]|nr:diguanylate cyclase [Planctomycetota bacterium]